MKRIFLFLTLFLSGLSAFAIGESGTKVGVVGGFTSSSIKMTELSSKSVATYNAGLILKVPIVSGLAIQPELTYSMKKSELSSENSFMSIDTSVGYLEGGVQLLWGPDLMLFKPYVFAEPFLGYAVNTKNLLSGSDLSVEKSIKDAINKFEYGLAVGGGVEVGRFQIFAKYFWNFGSLYSEDGVEGTILNAIKENKSFSGLSVGLGIFF